MNRITRAIASSAMALACAALLSVTPAHAESRKTILVLDASGSMWGKIDDGYKISIAQDVINDLLEAIPESQELGLITYGHRVKGDCGDIEVMVSPGPGTRSSIADAVNSLDPKGRTPLSAAVIQAADELRIEENPATVILISDGRETCDLDPCAVGTDLEVRGIDFTTHVIGFDIGEEKDLAQLRCLAENTGGQFLTASNALELTEALVEVVEVAEPEAPAIEDLQLIATAQDEDAVSIGVDIVWSLTSVADGETITLPTDVKTAEQLRTEVAPGKYKLEVTRTTDEATASFDINLVDKRVNVFVLELPTLLPEATLNADDVANVGQTIEVEWTGPDEQYDYIGVAEVGEQGLINQTRTDRGNPLTLQMPTEPGEFELRYLLHQGRRVLATRPISIVASDVTLEAANESSVGVTIDVSWVGPDEQYDFIAIAEIGEKRNINQTRTDRGNPLKLQMPTEAGEYELRYVLHQGQTIMATRPITITPSIASIIAADEASAGVSISVEWVGPNAQYDHISVAEIGAKKSINQTRTDRGNPLKLQMPTDTGDYELRYVLHQDQTILATKPITVVDATVSLDAADEANIGESVIVNWEGPDEQYDLIAVAEVGRKKLINQTRTDRGNPLKLQMPTRPGEYEIRYVLHQGTTVLATQPITVKAAVVELDAADEASVGESVVVVWDGPDERYDLITVGKVGKQKHINQVRTDRGNPLKIQMPTRAGEYEIRYVLHQGGTTIATRPITVTESDAEIYADDEAEVGAEVLVEWDGPDERYDLIAVGRPGKKKHINQVRTDQGSPLRIGMPTRPGNYEIRYVLHQGNTTIATHDITVVEGEVSLDAPDQAAPLEKIAIGWIGPDAKYDEIVIGTPGKQDRIKAVRTDRGDPVLMDMPKEPGNYEIRYVLHQGKTVLATHPIVIAE